MRYECPACKRSFDEPGFCPFDGKQLASTVRANSDAETIERNDTAETQTPPHAQQTVLAVSGRESDAAKQSLKDRVNEYDRLVGETLDGRYYVKAKLGEGGMGVVFEARHAVIERPLAIKVLKREATRDSATIKRFVQEAKASSRIGHPNIVEVTDFGTTPDGLTYSVMELVDGTTLSKVIKNEAPLPPERAVRIATQIARALEAAHGKGIVHRDLKPENVFLVDRDGRPDFVKIVDFGIAKVQPLEGNRLEDGPRLTRTGAVFGTPEYMAPEQAAGRSDTDRRVDIYALGTILYQMLVGRVPHKGGSMVRTIAMQMLDPITPPSQSNPELGISPKFEAVLMKALAKNRDDRYRTMAEFIAALDALGGELTTAPSMSLPPLPPGADSDAVMRHDATPPTIGPPRRAKPATKQLHEPEFVAGGPLQLPAIEDLPEPEQKPRWPLVLLVLVALAAGGVAVYVVVSHRSEEPVVAVARDAAARAQAEDARVIAEVPADAPEAPADAPTLVTATRDAGAHAPHDAAFVPGGPHPAKWTIEILTSPSDANLFAGETFLGPNGTHLERPWGTKLTIECKAPHYHGKKKIVFDGSVTSVMCAAKHLKMCVEGLKNPYDECENADGTQQGPVTQPTP